MTTHPDIEAFTWSNLYADVTAAMHDRSIQLYLETVINPALDAIERQISGLRIDEEPALAFLEADLRSLQAETIKAFVLSIQSIWERQLRCFLIQCAKDLKQAETCRSIEKEPWANLPDRLLKLRGISLRAFYSFSDLDLLHLLGSACRHGDGGAARDLYEREPGLWPYWPVQLPSEWVAPPALSHPPFAMIEIPRVFLARFTNAIVWFWEDLTYIYENSIQKKDPSVHKSLALMRQARAARSKA